MTFPEDRVLVGVINRKRDLEYVLKDHWYRIPQAKMTRGIQTEYVAFFLSRAFGEQNGGIYYYARITGLELRYRRWLLPDEANHPNADEQYYRIALSEIHEKQPPIRNTGKRSIAFIYTTWDRFIHAQAISDLYSKADYFVDRIYHALRNAGMRPQRFWEAEAKNIPFAPGICIPSVDGPIYATLSKYENAIYMEWDATETAIVEAIREELRKRGGLADVNVPMDNT
ncbi:MAG: hypothetical protein H7X77_01275 [Anaerolineae bacterium]|nr:hypothetical protein [Anaerolineae bacterium]